MTKPRDGWRALLGLPSDGSKLVADPIPSGGIRIRRSVGGYAETALQREYERILHAPEGTVNTATNRAAFSVGTLVGGGELDREYVYQRLVHDLAREKWGEEPDETHIGSVESGLSAGILHPRTAPEGGASSSAPEVDPEDALMAALARLEAALMTSADLDKMPNPEPLVDGLLYKNTLAWVIAEPGTGKSLATLDVAGCLGTGRKWHGLETQTGSTLYIVAEDEFGIKPRVRAWESMNGARMDGVLFLPVAVQAGSIDWEALTMICRSRKPDLVVIDTQSMCTIGRNEDKAEDMSVFVKEMDNIRVAAGACVLSVHHANKGGGMRGSTALPGAANTIMRLRRDENDLVSLTTKLSSGGKQRNAPPVDMLFEIVPHADSIVLKTINIPGGNQW